MKFSVIQTAVVHRPNFRLKDCDFQELILKWRYRSLLKKGIHLHWFLGKAIVNRWLSTATRRILQWRNVFNMRHTVLYYHKSLIVFLILCLNNCHRLRSVFMAIPDKMSYCFVLNFQFVTNLFRLIFSSLYRCSNEYQIIIYTPWHSIKHVR